MDQTAEQFTSEFLEELMELGKKKKVVGDSFKNVPQVMQFGRQFIFLVLKNQMYMEQFGQDAGTYYTYLAKKFLSAGMYVTDVWHGDMKQFLTWESNAEMLTERMDSIPVETADEMTRSVQTLFFEKLQQCFEKENQRDYLFGILNVVFDFGMCVKLYQIFEI